MLFNSFHFLWFFPLVLLLFLIIPRKTRTLWLLVASYYFYMSWNAKMAILIGLSTVVTFVCGILTEKLRCKKLVVAVSLIINLGILFFFKYFNFAWESVQDILALFNITIANQPFDIILPVGISFYTFQALGYTIDVYRGKITACRNIFKYALFVCFFPQLVAGPIERSDKLLTQIERLPEIKFDINRLKYGATEMLLGYFMKMVIADRACILVDNVFENYWCSDSCALILGAVMFAIQIYCDFASYSLIALGSSKIIGIELSNNFNTPYFALSIKDFWNRWHITLSQWFRDYLYIPLGGSRCSKTRKCLNLMITFLVSGLWHGAAFNYIAWGAIHGIYRIAGELTSSKRKAVTKNFDKSNTFSFKLCKAAITFALTTFAWIFFRSSSVKAALIYCMRIFTRIDMWSIFDKSLLKLGLDGREMLILVLAVTVLLLIDIAKYKTQKSFSEIVFSQNLPLRWIVLLGLFIIIVIFGAYGRTFDPQSFIYFQF